MFSDKMGDRGRLVQGADRYTENHRTGQSWPGREPREDGLWLRAEQLTGLEEGKSQQGCRDEARLCQQPCDWGLGLALGGGPSGWRERVTGTRASSPALVAGIQVMYF